MGWQPLGEGQVCRVCGGPNQGKGARPFSCGTRRVGPLHGNRHRGAANTGCNSVLSAHGIALLNAHPQPWFVDQIAIFRLIEEGLTPAKCVYLELLLTDATPSTTGFFRILHGSWEEGAG